jgi:hypothetical protein
MRPSPVPVSRSFARASGASGARPHAGDWRCPSASRRSTGICREAACRSARCIIRRTVALDTTDDEFALFIHWARSLRLDPLRRQVHAFVFHKHDPKKRRLSLVTSIEGFRAIAARTGNYRTDEGPVAWLCRVIGHTMPEPRDPADSRRDQGLDARQGPRHRQSSLRWSAPGKPAARTCESYLFF